MNISHFKAICLDFGDTLVHKPDLYLKLHRYLEGEGYHGSLADLRREHFLLRESTDFPVKTSRDFYNNFNATFLKKIGMEVSDDRIETIYSLLSSCGWEAFDDVSALGSLGKPLYVFSNWDLSFEEKITRLVPLKFAAMESSALIGKAKPDPDFFLRCLDKNNLSPQEVVYIGDSIKLDYNPCTKIGVAPILLDRYSLQNTDLCTIPSFRELKI